MSPMNIPYFNHSNSPISLPYPCPLTLHIQQLLVGFIMSSSHWAVMYFDIIHSLLFSFLFLLPPVPWNSPTTANMLSLYVHTYDHIWICMCAYLLDLSATYEKKHTSFWTWVTLLIMMISSYIHLSAKDKTEGK
jgi:hypothetical protein